MTAVRASDQPTWLKAAVALLVGRALILGLVSLPTPQENPDDTATVRVVGSVFIVLSLVVAYFIWNRRRWAAWAGIVLMVIDILLTLPVFLGTAGVAFTVLGIVGIISAVAVIVALRHRTVWPLLE